MLRYTPNAFARTLVAVAGLALIPAFTIADQPAASAQGPATAAPLVRLSDKTPADTHDARITVGGITISRERYGETTADHKTDAPNAPAAAPTAPATFIHTDGAIEVPLNTLGPGESLQQRSERSAAERDHARAAAFLAERAAEQPIESDAFGNPLRGYGYGGFYGTRGWFGGWGGGYGRNRGLIGPITTTTSTYTDQLHGTALSNFANAAAAGTGVLGNLHQDAIKAFGQAATPPIINAQTQRDQAQINIQKDMNKARKN